MMGLCCFLPRAVCLQCWHVQVVTSANHLQHRSAARSCGSGVRTEPCSSYLQALLPARGAYLTLSLSCSLTPVSLRVGNVISSYFCCIASQKNYVSRMSQKSGKQRRRYRIFCFWSSAAATAGAFCLHCAQESESSGKADAGSPFNPLSSANNSGGLTSSCCMKPSAWKPVKKVGLFRAVI